MGELSISFLMWILNKIIYEASFVIPVQELMSSVSSIVSEASFSECLNRYLVELLSLKKGKVCAHCDKSMKLGT